MATTTASIADDVIRASEQWYSRLVSSEKGGRALMSLLCGLLVFLGSIIIIFVSDSTPYKLTDYFIQYGATLYFEISIGASFGIGLLYYLFSSKRKSSYDELAKLIAQAKIEGESRPEPILALINHVTGLLPKANQDRYDSAFLYGVLAFFLTAFLFPWNFIIALVIWLYFRYEASSEFNREILRFDAWKLRFQK